MKLAIGKWNISIVGENKPVSYYGYATKKQAQAFADKWNSSHDIKVEVIKQ